MTETSPHRQVTVGSWCDCRLGECCIGGIGEACRVTSRKSERRHEDLGINFRERAGSTDAIVYRTGRERRAA